MIAQLSDAQVLVRVIAGKPMLVNRVRYIEPDEKTFQADPRKPRLRPFDPEDDNELA